jgi:hypothetical protein
LVESAKGLAFAVAGTVIVPTEVPCHKIRPIGQAGQSDTIQLSQQRAMRSRGEVDLLKGAISWSRGQWLWLVRWEATGGGVFGPVGGRREAADRFAGWRVLWRAAACSLLRA